MVSKLIAIPAEWIALSIDTCTMFYKELPWHSPKMEIDNWVNYQYHMCHRRGCSFSTQLITWSGHSFNIVALKNEFVLLSRWFNINTWQHFHIADDFLAQEIPDFHGLTTFLYNTVDGEMGVHRPHLVQEALQENSRDFTCLLHSKMLDNFYLPHKTRN